MPGYGILPEKEGKGLLDWVQVEQQLIAARNYWLASVTLDGAAHAVPLWGLWHKGRFYFGTDARSQKAENLRANAKVVLHLESGDDAVIVEGEAGLEADGQLLAELDGLYQAKYAVPLVGAAPTHCVRPRKVFAWIEADFPGTATRWVFAET